MLELFANIYLQKLTPVMKIYVQGNNLEIWIQASKT